VGRENSLFVHLTLVPYIAAAGELKTKPTQHSVRELMEIGIQPDILICRTERPLGDEVRRKIARFCNVDVQNVIDSRDVETIYEVPLRYRDQRLDDDILRLMGIEAPEPDMSAWEELVERIKRPRHGRVEVAVVGKYTSLVDSYKSIQEAIIHGGIANDVGVDIDWISSEELDTGGTQILKGYDAVLVPGGFGQRGISGMLEALRYLREGGVPFLGICLGLQCAIIEFARNVCGLVDSHSAEFDRETSDPVISLLDSQLQVTDMGGTMRLGAYPCRLLEGSRAREIYGSDEASERHRHRYEVNPAYRERLEEGGMAFSGVSPDGQLVEIVELHEHPFFIATQFHAELRSRPSRPHPLFAAFIAAAVEQRAKREGAPSEQTGDAERIHVVR
jgi:CTP synthase